VATIFSFSVSIPLLLSLFDSILLFSFGGVSPGELLILICIDLSFKISQTSKIVSSSFGILLYSPSKNIKSSLIFSFNKY
jgi:hypothetical protein